MTQPRDAPLWGDRHPDRALDVLGIGQCCVDHVCVLDRLPAFTEKEPIRDYQLLPGGPVATALLAAARLGLGGALVSTTGDDAAAQVALAPLVRAGLDTSRVRCVPGARTQFAMILVDRPSGERTVIWRRDPRLELRDGDVPADLIERARCLLMDGGDPETGARAARLARAAGVPVVLDVDACVPGVEALLAEADFPIVSAQFAETFSQDGTIRGGLERLQELGARLAVTTVGARGCVALEGGRELRSPGFAVTPRDSTGAGDVFHAAFVWGLLEGYGVEQVLRVANAAAAMSCRSLGAQGGLPSRSELEAFLQAREPAAGREDAR